MKPSEFLDILAAILVLAVVSSFNFAINNRWPLVIASFFFSILIIIVNVFSKKFMAFLLDSSVEHEIWKFSRFGFYPGAHFKKEKPFGIIIPLLLTLITLGILKFSAILTYETRALKYRAAKRFGFYSYTEMTDFHNAVIGVAGIIAILLLALISYFLPFQNFELLARMAIYYSFFNLIPVSKLDGTQIFFGSRILWTTLAIITIIATAYALLIPFA